MEMIHSINELIDQTIATMQKAANEPCTAGVPSGLEALDRVLCGFENSDLIVVGGRPAMGKTCFLISLAINMARQNMPVLFYSLEMTNAQIIRRIISNVSGIERGKISTGDLSSEERQALAQSTSTIGNYPIYIDDKPNYEIEELCEQVRKDVEQSGAKAVLIDYLQLLSTKQKLQNRYEEISLCTRKLKQLARELELPVIVTSQLNRYVENRPSGFIPQLSDMRDSGTICEDANVILLFYRPELYMRSGEDECGRNIRGVVNVIIAKNHMGSTNEIRLKLSPTGRLEDWTD